MRQFLAALLAFLALAAAQPPPTDGLPSPLLQSGAAAGYVLTAFLPAAALPPPDLETARFSVVKGWASPGWWTAAFVPIDATGEPLACPPPASPLTADALRGFNLTTAFFWAPTADHQSLTQDLPAWAAAWAGGGACAGLGAVEFFAAAFRAAALAAPALGSLAPGPVAEASLATAFNGSYVPGSALCAAGGGLVQVSLCADAATLAPALCPAGARAGAAAAAFAEPCAGTLSLASLPAATSKRIIPGLLRGQDPATFAPLAVWWWTPAAVALAAAVLAAAWAAAAAAAAAGWLPTLFAPREVKVVRNPLVARPVSIHCEPLDMAWAAAVAPDLAAVIVDLPRGVGLKGGVARKLLKHRFGAPEPPSSFDVDCAVMLLGGPAGVPPAAARAAKDALVGARLGALTLEAQDCEVDDAHDLIDYFLTRDVSINEVLILKTGAVGAPGALFLHTADAAADAAADVVRPCCHGRAAAYTFQWEADSRGRPHAAARPVARSVIRRLKGHGSAYAFDAGTLRHWKREGLPESAVFQVLRPFHTRDAAYAAALKHLLSLGVVKRAAVAAAGGPDRYWGALLASVNAGAARFGGRLTLAELDVDAVDAWAEAKKASVGAGIVTRAAAATRSGYIASDESAASLGVVKWDDGVATLLKEPITFDAGAYLAAAGRPPPAAAAATASDEPPPPPGLADLVKRRAAPRSTQWADTTAAASAAAVSRAALPAGAAGAPLVGAGGAPPPAPASAADAARLAWGAATLAPWWLAGSLALTLAGLAATLFVPRAFGVAFEAVIARDSVDFLPRFNELVGAYLLAWLADTAASLALAGYGAAVTRPAFHRLFVSALRQLTGAAPARTRLPLGEVLARNSGDALALRAVVASAGPALLASGLLAAGAAACVLERAAALAARGQPGVLIAACVVLSAVVAEAVVFAVVGARLSYTARSALGRLFAFSLAVFTSAKTVSTLGLEPRARRDHAALASRFYGASLALGVAAAAHVAFLLAAGAGLRAATLWAGGAQALAAGSRAPAGSIFTVLLLCRLLQTGLAGAGAAAAALVEAGGSLRRLVELHGAGVMARGWLEALERGGGKGDEEKGGGKGGDSSALLPPTAHGAVVATVLTSPTDRAAAARALVADGATLLSPAAAHAFAASVEDNVTAAAAPGGRGATAGDVADAIARSGLGRWVATLPDGARSRVGPKTTGSVLPRSVLTRLALARALLAAAPVLAVEDAASLLATAPADVAAVLAAEAARGAAVVCLVESQDAADELVAAGVASRVV